MEDTPIYSTGMETAPPAVEMPRYITHKRVWALKIARIEQAPADQERQHPEGDYVLHFERPGYAPRTVSADWVSKRGARAGGYLVQYEGDGYCSWAPAEVFEASATPADQWGLTRAQEPKYRVTLQGKLANRFTGKPIPDEEPLFILRGQDILALPILCHYRDLLPTERRASAEERILAFSAFGDAHPGRLKLPDSRPPIPPEPTSIRLAGDPDTSASQR